MVKTSGYNTSLSFSAGDLNEKGINPKYYNEIRVTTPGFAFSISATAGSDPSVSQQSTMAIGSGIL